MHLFYLLAIALIISGCSKTPPADDYFVASTVTNRIETEVQWRQGRCLDACAYAFIESALSEELTADTAVQIALLNSPKIQAIFEDLGIAHADVVEAALLSNPSFAIDIRYPHTTRLHTNIEYLLTSSLLDLLLRPLRTKLAATQFEQTKLEVANAILNIAFEVRESYYALLADEKKLSYLQSIADLTDIKNELSIQQFKAGNNTALEWQRAQSKTLEAELEVAQSQTEMIRLKEKLNRLLGLSVDFCFVLPDFPDAFICEDIDLSALESVALQNRLDLEVLRFEIVHIAQMLGLKGAWTYTNLQAGLAGEREADGPHLIGPAFSAEVPIFNYGQAARMRLYAQLRQAQESLAELEITVRSQVREAYAVLITHSKIVNHYNRRLLPIQKEICLSSEKLYNVMGLGIDKLLENKLEEFIAYKHYTESMKKFLIAKVALDRALGLNFECVLEEGTP